MAWLHGVLHFVVLEEHNRAEQPPRVAGWRDRETSSATNRLDRADPAPDQLDALIQKELQQIVVECMPALDADYRRVLKMRADGLKYGDIALRLGVSENTVATWVSRGIRTLAQCVRRRTQPRGKRQRACRSGNRDQPMETGSQQPNRSLRESRTASGGRARAGSRGARRCRSVRAIDRGSLGASSPGIARHHGPCVGPIRARRSRICLTPWWRAARWRRLFAFRNRRRHRTILIGGRTGSRCGRPADLLGLAAIAHILAERRCSECAPS